MGTNSYKLSDDVIGQIAKLLQLAIITGTDVVDNIRTIRVRVDDETGSIVPDPEYIASFEANLNKLVATAALAGSLETDSQEN
jgi:hypothetical protein